MLNWQGYSPPSSQGVKKLGHSLEHSYNVIKQFLQHHFQTGLQGLQLYLGQTLGMARWHDRFGEMGLCESAVQGCIRGVGALALKTLEMLQ